MIRNYDRDVIILEDEYQDVLNVKFNEQQELQDLAERVDVIKRTQSVAAFMEKTGRTQSRFMSMAGGNYANRTASHAQSPMGIYKGKTPVILEED